MPVQSFETNIENMESRRKARKRRIIIGITSFLILLVVIGAVLGIIQKHKNMKTSAASAASSTTDSTINATLATSVNFNSAIKAVCSVTLHPDRCYSTISSFGRNITDTEKIFEASVKTTMDVLRDVSSFPATLRNETDDPRVKKALDICTKMIDDSLDQLNQSLILMAPKSGEQISTEFRQDDLTTWLSATISNQETCLDSFEGTEGGFREKMEVAMTNSTELISNSLAIASKVLGYVGLFNSPGSNRKLLQRLINDDNDPGWTERRRLLQTADNVNKLMRPNIIVAKDGTGDFLTINDALKTVPLKSEIPYVIYIKSGLYVEDVEITTKMTSVMFIGDGIDSTVISGSKNFVDGTPTFDTATLVVEGSGFIMKGVRVQNTAGPEKHQAVALRAKADKCIFYECGFIAFQDTLYVHSLRQFFKKCVIVGTVDFIFGDAAAVFQDCDILPRQPMPNQFNAITAQGKKDPSENTGISFQNCTIRPYDVVTAKTYLGRPWKEFSTTVFMKSDIGSLVEPEGWLSWDGVKAPPSTIFYGEYMNAGVGANTAGRVVWSGYIPGLSDIDAQKFSVGSLINGDEWLPNKGVEFNRAL